MNLIKAGAKVNQTNYHNGDTALAYSICEGYCNCAKILIESGADVNLTSHDGDTPLILAANWDQQECVNLLLKSGADVNQADNDGDTPLLSAAITGSEAS